MKVLIVDDERSALRQVSRVLRKVEPDAEVHKTDDGDEALKLCGEIAFDIVFLDIEMPSKDGLTLAGEIKGILPMTNIVIITAYPEYALQAYKLYVSDYVLKPVVEEDLRNALDNLRNPIGEKRKGLYVRCFGNFTVFYDGKVVSFGRSKTKEMFAYLIDRKGAECTNAQLRAVLWGDQVRDDYKQRHYFAQIAYELSTKLEELGLGDIYVHRRDSYAIVPDRIPCDYYEALKGKGKAKDFAGFEGEYMSQYEWAEFRIGTLM